ncbi:MAG: ATP-binding cassette domain-containing protein [Sphingobacteriaceae bacterium]|nr:ATP-binding cassette domain-containing protein [Sphingobacteriaceae bacterium]
MKALTISINNAGKKFGREWVFRNLNQEILPGDRLVIQGGNGSGKSTLLQIISGFISLNEGEITFKGNESIQIQDIYKQISFASPYLQLVEDFTLREMAEHIVAYKPLISSMQINDLIKLSGLQASEHKFIKQFSSGMKQRLKIALALLCDSGLLLLDEPISNLDAQAIDWYKNMIQEFAGDRTVIVCSNNIQNEFFFCTKHLNIEDYKLIGK